MFFRLYWHSQSAQVHLVLYICTHATNIQMHTVFKIGCTKTSIWCHWHQMPVKWLCMCRICTRLNEFFFFHKGKNKQRSLLNRTFLVWTIARLLPLCHWASYVTPGCWLPGSLLSWGKCWLLVYLETNGLLSKPVWTACSICTTPCFKEKWTFYLALWKIITSQLWLS